MDQRSVFAFCFQVRGFVFFLRTTINYESKDLLRSKKAVSDVLEGVLLNIFSGGKAPDSSFLPAQL